MCSKMVDKKIKIIIFDWFGVCTKENWVDCLARELHQKLGLDETIIRGEFKKVLQPFAKAELSPEQFLKKFIGALDKNKNSQEFYYLFETIPELNKELLNFILKLKKNHKVFLLSNNFVPIFPNYEKKIDFKKYFDSLFLSFKLKVSKTQREIWDIVLSKLNYSIKELLFIDNKEKYFEYPKELGMKTILFKNNKQLINDLKKFGVEA